MFLKKCLSALATVLVGSMICAGVLASSTLVNPTATQQQTPTGDHPSPQALKFAINAYQWALDHHDVSNPNILTVVDFTKPSDEKRLWVINLKNDEVLMHTYVAQGRNTGKLYARHFSNIPGSLESSPGIFTTEDTAYDGEHGRSLRVNGLEAGINSNALARAIVIHQASYVTSQFIQANGYAGRSWGCFAVSPRLAERLISLVKGGTVLFADAPQEKEDSRVNHALSAEGRVLYANIMHGSYENGLERFFHSL